MREEPVDHLDLFQTLLDAAGCRLDLTFGAKRRYPGRSYLPLLAGQQMTWRKEPFCEYGNARYEQPERSAKKILSQPPCNRVEPWRIERPA